MNRIVEQAAGNALYLEEPIRAAAEGKGDELPETVLAMLQRRLLHLDPDARRVLRAASVFGATFWKGGVVALIGPDRSANHVNRKLRALIEAEIIKDHPESRFPGDAEYAFRHALMREASYSLLAEGDRELGHHLAGAYLEALGEPDPMVLAEHYRLGGTPGASRPLLCPRGRAILRQLRHGCGARARPARSGRGRERRGARHPARPRAQGPRLPRRVAIANERGVEGLSLVPPGSTWAYRAMNLMFVIAGTMNLRAQFAELVTRFSSMQPAPDARAAYVEAATGLIVVLSLTGMRREARFFVGRMAEVSAGIIEHDVTARGWLKYGHVAFVRNAEADPYLSMTLAGDETQSFQQAGNMQGLLLTKAVFGVSQVELGDAVRAEGTMREVVALADHIKNAFCTSNAKVYLAQVLIHRVRPVAIAEAEALAREVAKTSDKAIFVGRARGVLAEALLARGNLAGAEAEARRGAELLAAVTIDRLRVTAILADALLRQGRVEDGRAVAEEGLARLEQQLGGGGYPEIALLVAVAEARLLAGDASGSADARRTALDRICKRARWQASAARRPTTCRPAGCAARPAAGTSPIPSAAARGARPGWRTSGHSSPSRGSPRRSSREHAAALGRLDEPVGDPFVRLDPGDVAPVEPHRSRRQRP